MKYLFRREIIHANASHPARGAWIEIEMEDFAPLWLQSHPARGAWIEITSACSSTISCFVAPRKGCVD